jgi:predicted nuclease of restriction endonuclease-like (RecB) superfamily
MRIENSNERHFYEVQAANEQWTVRQLQRQYGSSLYERLALSRNKDEVMRLAKEGQTIEKPRDILKNPLVLEFLNMAEDSAYSETDLESAIIAKLQKFLLELGNGFLFEARQKRFSFDEKSFFVDLVFYKFTMPANNVVVMAVFEAEEETPIRTPQIASSNIHAYAMGNSIVLQNLPAGAKVEVYGLNGKLITTSHSPLAISVQT